MGNVVGDIRNVELRGDARDFPNLRRNKFQAMLPFLVKSFVIFLEVALQRLDHANNFLFPDLLAAAERVFVRAVVQECVADQVFASNQQAGALRAANA